MCVTHILYYYKLCIYIYIYIYIYVIVINRDVHIRAGGLGLGCSIPHTLIPSRARRVWGMQKGMYPGMV